VNRDERMIKLIDEALPNIPDTNEDSRVLRYIRSQLTPEGLQAREDEWGGNPGVQHLHEVARQRLRPYVNQPIQEDNQ
jgi:hypothetical protein